MLLETIIASLMPIGIEGVKQGLSHLFGGAKALTIDDQIKLDNNEIERIKALALLDTPIGTPSQWVVDLRASARYVGALSIIAIGIGSIYISSLSPTIQAIALEAANIAFGFLFGSRIVSNLMKK